MGTRDTFSFGYVCQDVKYFSLHPFNFTIRLWRRNTHTPTLLLPLHTQVTPSFIYLVSCCHITANRGKQHNISLKASQLSFIYLRAHYQKNNLINYYKYALRGNLPHAQLFIWVIGLWQSHFQKTIPLKWSTHKFQFVWKVVMELAKIMLLNLFWTKVPTSVLVHNSTRRYVITRSITANKAGQRFIGAKKQLQHYR